MTIPRNWRVVDDARKMLVMQHDLFRHIEIELFVARSQLLEANQFLKHALTEFGGQSSDCDDESLAEWLLPHRGTYLHRYPICFRRILPDDTLISMCSPNQSNPDDDWYAISCLLYTSPSPRDATLSRMPSSA